MKEPQFCYIRGHFTNHSGEPGGWKFWDHESKGSPNFTVKVRVPDELLPETIEAEEVTSS